MVSATMSNPTLIDHIREVSDKFYFPTELQIDEYRHTSKQVDIIQVYFRYHPFSEVDEKFGFEISFADKLSSSKKEIYNDEINRKLSQLESMWKHHFNLIFYQDIPYAKEIDGNTYHLKCELCDGDITITREDVHEEQDLLLLYCLKCIDCDCNNGGDQQSIDEDLHIKEGTLFPRSSV